jgi:hypothetical protein
MYKTWAMPSNKVSDEDRRLIDEAITKGQITKIRPGAAQNDEMHRTTRELAAEERKEFNRKKKKEK